MSKRTTDTEIHRDDLRIELWLSHLLRGGVNTALLLVVLGFIINYVKGQSGMGPTELSDLISGKGNLHSEPPRNLTQFIYGFRALEGLNFIQGALILLILLPGFRVAFLLGSFLRQRDWVFSILAFLVLSFMSVGTIFRIMQ